MHTNLHVYTFFLQNQSMALWPHGGQEFLNSFLLFVATPRFDLHHTPGYCGAEGNEIIIYIHPFLSISILRRGRSMGCGILPDRQQTTSPPAACWKFCQFSDSIRKGNTWEDFKHFALLPTSPGVILELLQEGGKRPGNTRNRNTRNIFISLVRVLNLYIVYRIVFNSFFHPSAKIPKARYF